ncbi:MAG: DUF4395 domain-containing protein [Ilumatobacteraceae bacterium]
MTKLFSFPHPVNETSARLVAAGVVILATTFALTGNPFVLAALTFGFVARVLCGPTFSPLARFVTQVITPRLNVKHRFVSGPPKRFAQGIGAAFTLGATVLALADATTAARIVIALLAIAAFLEAAFAICLGCIVFGRLMRLSVIPQSVCEECNNFNARQLTTQTNRA